MTDMAPPNRPQSHDAASGHGSDTKQSPLVTAAQLDSPEGRAAYARYLVSVGREDEIPYLVGGAGKESVEGAGAAVDGAEPEATRPTTQTKEEPMRVNAGRDAAVVNRICLLEYLLHEARDLIATKKRLDWSARYEQLIDRIDGALGYKDADGCWGEQIPPPHGNTICAGCEGCKIRAAKGLPLYA